MKAIVYEKYGAPEVLQLKEMEKPTPKNNEVLVKVCTTTVTAGDTRMRSFTVPLSFWLPARLTLGVTKPKHPVLGMELAGEVVAVGQDVTQFKPGDQVFASTLEHWQGAYAEYVCLPADGLVAKKSTDLTCAEATTIPIGGRTALYFLREAHIRPGQQVLIYGASGSVGTFAVQIAKYYGAEVTGVCSATNLELVKSLGADKVIDYTRNDFSLESKAYDVIFDTVGKLPYGVAMRALKDNGVYLQAVSGPAISLRMQWTAMTSGVKTVGGGPPPDTADLVFLQELMAAGELKPVFDRDYSWEQIVEAHRYVDTGRKKGNVIIHVNHNHQPDIAAESLTREVDHV
jgi:NADPH:quinone reductase-like Zn-dependent oxidoreductase